MRTEDAALVADQAFIVNALPYLKAEADKQIRELENRTFTALDKGELTPELALYAWMEIRAVRKTLSRFETRARIGASVGAKLDNLGN